MKGIAPIGILALIAVIGLLFYFGSGLIPGSLTPPPGFTCPEGEEPNWVNDADICGTQLEKKASGFSGACVPVNCPMTMGDEPAFCKVGITWVANQPPLGQLSTLQPGESFFDQTLCNLDLQQPGSSWYYWEDWVNRVQECWTCIPSDVQCTDECVAGAELRCGGGSEIQWCVGATADKPCAHWDYYMNCAGNAICNEISPTNVQCVSVCGSDIECTGLEYCDSSTNTCKMSKLNGELCERSAECLSGYCGKYPLDWYYTCMNPDPGCTTEGNSPSFARPCCQGLTEEDGVCLQKSEINWLFIIVGAIATTIILFVVLWLIPYTKGLARFLMKWWVFLIVVILFALLFTGLSATMASFIVGGL